MAFEFAVPDKIFMGENALALAKDTLAGLGTHALIVSGKVVTKTGLVNKLTDILDEVGIKWTIFNDITNEPTDKMIEAGVKAYKDAGCDFGIGIGGRCAHAAHKQRRNMRQLKKVKFQTIMVRCFQANTLQ